MSESGVSYLEDNELHPTIIEFKEFINRHPRLLEKIRKSGRPWQEYYEKWVLLGEDDQYWEQYKDESPEKNGETTMKWMEQLGKITKNVDFNKVQEHVSELSGTVSTLQSLLHQSNSESEKESSKSKNNLLSMFKD